MPRVGDLRGATLALRHLEDVDEDGETRMSSPPLYECRAKRHMPADVFVTYDTMIGLAKSDTKEFRDKTSRECYAGRFTICDYGNQSEDEVRRNIKWLVARGWLVKLKQFGSHGSNRYRVIEHDEYTKEECPPFRHRDSVKGPMPFNLLWQKIKSMGGFSGPVNIRPDIRFGWNCETGEGFVEVKSGSPEDLNKTSSPGDPKSRDEGQVWESPEPPSLGAPKTRDEGQVLGSADIKSGGATDLFCIDSVLEKHSVKNHSVPTNHPSGALPTASEQKSVGRLDGWLTACSEYIPCNAQGKYDDLNGDCQFVACMGKPTDEQRAKLEDFLSRLVSRLGSEGNAEQEFADLLTRFAQRPRGLEGLSFPWSKFIEEQTDNE